MTRQDIPTPALVVDRELLERNLSQMMAALSAHGCALRPHFKFHRTPELAKLQVRHGARGITCATVGEAEVVAAHNLGEILIANEIATADKMDRVATIAETTPVIVAVDDIVQAQGLSAAARRRGVRIGVVVDVDVGLNRCGVATPEAAVELAGKVDGLEHLDLRGIMGYEGHLQYRPPGEEKVRLCHECYDKLAQTKALFEQRGLCAEIISGGGSGTYLIAAEYGVLTEVQAGTYALMDTTYIDIVPEFALAEVIAATVISRPAADRAVTDAGLKSIHSHRGLPQVHRRPGVRAVRIHAEHTVLELDEPGPMPRIGERVEFYVPYADGTVNLHREMYVTERGDPESEVCAVWQIAGHGRSC